MLRWMKTNENTWKFILEYSELIDIDVLEIEKIGDDFYMNSDVMRSKEILLGTDSLEEAKELAIESFSDFVDQQIDYYTEMKEALMNRLL